MATALLEKRIATGNAHVLNAAPAPIAKSRKKRLFARWLIDENYQLYCQWFIED